MKKLKNMGLLPRIIIAIALGIGAGFVFPGWLACIFVTFNGLFSQFLGFFIPLLILGFVAPAIADVGDKAGKMLFATIVLAFLFTILSGLITFFVGDAIFPNIIEAIPLGIAEKESAAVAPLFTVDMPPLMGVMTALVLAFVIGLGCAVTKAASLTRGLGEFRDIISWVIKRAIIPLLPIYIFGIFLNMTLSGDVGPILRQFGSIIGIIFGLHVFMLVLQYCIASLFVHNNPFKALWGMMPAYFTALGTASSAATIPVTLNRAIAIGVDRDVAGFTIPLCATIHMSGSMLKMVACSMALMLSSGMPYDLGLFAGFIGMLTITIIAAPGVPGGVVMAALGILTSILGFNAEQNAIMIALYLTMDSFGTACNVTGDGAIAQIIGKYFGAKSPKAEPKKS